MLRRRLIGLGVAALLLGAAVLAAVWLRPNADLATLARPLLPDLAMQTVIRIELDNPSGRFVLEREARGGGWQILEPVKAEADSEMVIKLLSALAGAESSTPIEVEDLEPFGLAPPRAVVTLEDHRGGRQSLEAGARLEFDDRLYVRPVSEPAVLLTEGSLWYRLHTSLFGLREKRLLRFSRGDVKSLRVGFDGEHRYQIEWRETGPYVQADREGPADADVVTRLVDHIRNIRARRFVSEEATPEDLEVYGLAVPGGQVEIELSSGKKHVLLLGRRFRERQIRHYAMRADSRTIIETTATFDVEKIYAGYEELRQRRVLTFVREAVALIHLEEGGARVRLRRQPDSGQGRGRWHLGEADAALAQDSEVHALLFRLWRLRFEKIVAEEASAADFETHGLAPPRARVELVAADGERLAVLLVGKSSQELTAVSAEGSGRIDLVLANTVEGISFAPDAWVAEP